MELESPKKPHTLSGQVQPPSIQANVSPVGSPATLEYAQGKTALHSDIALFTPNEQQWRVICARILKEPKSVTNVHFVAIDDYGTTLQDLQGKGEGPST